jgi:hypothetical protein
MLRSLVAVLVLAVLPLSARADFPVVCPPAVGYASYYRAPFQTVPAPVLVVLSAPAPVPQALPQPAPASSCYLPLPVTTPASLPLPVPMRQPRPTDRTISRSYEPRGNQNQLQATFQNQTPLSFLVKVNGQAYILLAGQDLTVKVDKRDFTWQLDGREAERGQVAPNASAATIVIER